ncbi:MAG TPA: GGDEF domain-containing protein [Spirochaetota bacterium]|nr:GGDEF domain-containing protein [Spirochaetota bacterium]HPP51138.1 GGDEF domain-containing protein [Spirochaetota bacterium]
MNTFQLIHSILTINEQGTIIKKHYSHALFEYNNLKDALDIGSIDYFNTFMQTVLSQGYAIGHSISFNVNNQYIKLILNGIQRNDVIHIFMLYDFAEAINAELQTINNELINTLRNTIKNFSDWNVGEPIFENKLFEEMAQLNNQLINMQRELVKKNIEIKNLNEKLQQIAITDPLTGAFNRRYFYQKISEEIARAKRNNYSISLLYIDLNNFKTINDTYGHEQDDRILTEFTKVVKFNIRNNIDSLFRFGGDEFVILLIDCTEEYANKVIERINKEVSKIHNLLSMAYGISQIAPDKENIDIEAILVATDKKMYNHKKAMKMH